MGAIGVVLLVAFIVVCVLLVLLVLVQDDGSHGMGGLLGGRGTAAFGSHSASVLTKATFTLVVLFFALALSLALLNRRPAARRDLAPAAGQEKQATQNSETKKWYDEEAAENAEEGTSEAAENAAVEESGAVESSASEESAGEQVSSMEQETGGEAGESENAENAEESNTVAEGAAE